MKDIEAQLLNEIETMMKLRGKTQADFAAHRGVSRQAVSPYFSGGRKLLTGTAAELLDFLDATITLVPNKEPVEVSTPVDARDVEEIQQLLLRLQQLVTKTS